jgi:flagellar FliJ protein
MPRFQFRLATLLTLRQSVRHQRRAELTEALQQADALAARLNVIDGELHDLRRRSSSALGGINVDLLRDADRYHTLLETQRRQVESQQLALAAEIELRRKRLLEADRDVRALEKLEQNQKLHHDEQQERLVRRELDRVAARGHGCDLYDA